MMNLTDYIKECLDIENFEYKFDVWFDKDKKHLEPILDLFKGCADRKIVQKDDVEKFIERCPDFKVKKFVDFFDEDVKRDESINVDYIYLFTKIIERFITNFNLKNKVEYSLQVIRNGEPNVEKNPAPQEDNKPDIDVKQTLA